MSLSPLIKILIAPSRVYRFVRRSQMVGVGISVLAFLSKPVRFSPDMLPVPGIIVPGAAILPEFRLASADVYQNQVILVIGILVRFFQYFPNTLIGMPCMASD